MTRILLVEDEAALAAVLTDRLVAEGYEVVAADDGAAGEELARTGDFDLIVLDWMLPGRTGLEVCRDLRADRIATPLLMLTARGELTDKVSGLRMGADDYLTKPFEMAELTARIEALLRREARHDEATTPGETHDGHTLFGDVTLDPDERRVRRGGQPVELSARELDLLLYLVRHPGETLSRDRLLSEVWDYDRPPLTRTVDVHVSLLRQKLESDSRRPRFIRTVHGVGYKFVP